MSTVPGSEPPSVERGGPPGSARAYAPPPQRLGLAPRPRLVSSLLGDRAPVVVALTAPAGFGKTTVLVQWAAAEEREVVWLGLRAIHDDAVVLADEVIAGLGEIMPVDPELARLVAAPRPPLMTRILPRLGRSLRASDRSFLLVLDDAHHLRSRGALELLDALAASLPPDSQLAIGSRSDLGGRSASLRASGALVVVGPKELAFTEEETAEVLALDSGSAGQASSVWRSTEGWPIAVSIASRALSEQSPAQREREFRGDHHLLAEYVRTELLRSQSPDVARFLLESSVLERLSGWVCDEVLERSDSASLLDGIARQHMFLNPLDPRHESFALHQLVRDALRAELVRRHPARRRQLDLRAIEALAARGDADGCIRHALAAGERGTAAALLWQFLPMLITGGRVETATRWLDEFSPTEELTDPHVALSRAWTYVETRSDLVAQWVRRAELTGHQGPLSDGNALEAMVAVLRATIGAEGIEAVGRDARRAVALVPDHSVWRPLCRFFEGASLHLRGRSEPARPLLEEGAALGSAFPTAGMLNIAWLGVIAVFDEDWSEARRATEASRMLVVEWGLTEYGSAAISFALEAATAAQDERHAEARGHLTHARRLLARIEGVAPFFATTIRVLLARASLLVGDSSTSSVMLSEARSITMDGNQGPVLTDRLADLEATLAAVPSGRASEAASLTSAEMRVLMFLPTYLSLREIGERLYVSRHTVKSQAMSIYRKLGASSRGEAVEQAVRLGLLEEQPPPELRSDRPPPRPAKSPSHGR